MIYYILWALSFIGLFLGIFWINIMFFKRSKKIRLKELPLLSVIIAAYNEEKTISKTIESVLGLDYPRNKLEVIVVDDGSRDGTYSIARGFRGVKVIRNKHLGVGKSSAVNAGLRIARGKFFGVVDADSTVTKNSLKIVLSYFSSDKVGGVISAIKISNRGRFYAGLQKLEYAFTVLARELMSRLGTLHFSHGVLSVFRTGLIKDLGYFDENNLTEDLEIAMRLKANNYDLVMAHDSFTYTNVPSTFRQLWNQRVRWYRGMMANLKKYHYVLFNPRYGFYGLFQIPLNFFTVFSISLVFVIFAYQLFKILWDNVIRFLLLRFEIFYGWDLPPLKFLLLSFDVKFLFPVIVIILLNLYLLYRSYEMIKEKPKIFNFVLIVFFIVYPLLTMFHWIAAIFGEIFGAKRKW